MISKKARNNSTLDNICAGAEYTMPHDLTPQQLAGRIKSVYCKDFVSYNEVTYYPGEYLNVLTGPNGTGKSTIMSAIILGLGGEPNLLDRSASIADYIKSDKTRATIIVKIHGKVPHSLMEFQRNINPHGDSQFLVNGETMSKKKYLTAVAVFNIQVGNLCQFLPQDRVQDFSKMNAQDLLKKTMSSVCENDELVTSFMELKELRKQQLGAHVDRNKDLDNLRKEEKRLEQLQTIVDQFHERQEIVEKLNVSKAKKMWLEVESSSASLLKSKEKLETARADGAILKKKYDLQKRAQEVVMKKKNNLRIKTLATVEKLSEVEESKSELYSQLDNVKGKILEQQNIFQRDKQNAVRSTAELENITNLLEAQKAELQEFDKGKDELLANLDQQQQLINKTQQEVRDIYAFRQELEEDVNVNKVPPIVDLERKIERLKNAKETKIKELGFRHQKLIEAVHWLRKNKNKFKSKIYEPLLFELSVRCPENAKYVENTISQRDLFAFACEDKQDMSALIDELCVKQKLGVNIIYCDPVDKVNHVPTVPLDQLKEMGFHSYLVDLVTGPTALINMLCTHYSAHNIPIGSDRVNQFATSIPKSIRVYFGGDKRFTVSSSKYSANTILTENQISPRNQIIALDHQLMASLEKRRDEALKEKAQALNKMAKMEAQFDRLNVELKDHGEKKKKYEQKLAHFNKLKSEIKQCEQKIQMLKKSIISTDVLQKKLLDNVKIYAAQLVKLDRKRVQVINELHAAYSEKQLANASESIYKAEHATQTDTLNELEAQMRNVTTIINQIMVLIETQKQKIKAKMLEAQQLCNGQLPTDRQFPYKSEFAEMADHNLEQVNEIVHECEARLECMANVDTDVMADFRRRQDEVEKLKKSIESKVTCEANVEAEITSRYNEWDQKLTELIDTISTKFSEFMDSINYVGEVVLAKKENYDFDSYGIQIMVQYRKNLQLQALDKYVQSGGERAVAIAVYSMSLQHVTHVPFRCVDEINQGMDAKNERHIYNLLLNEATKDGSAQYIFVTPKLLPNLPYNDRLCVSIVHNSETMGRDIKFA